MFKVFESFDLSHAGQLQSLLESHGIRTFLKNQFSAGALGELPFVEICPQLFVLEEADLPRARELLRSVTDVESRGAWTCGSCGTDVEAPFLQCWQCGEPRPDSDADGAPQPAPVS
ncbi:DUF2007 domain-containing protein [Elongatibacter sediminis]|uniref:DUF2007 domain-containing protein n=1 Tax=Elongatibacter sediminis TaxID=3119006 RepID=A0AAW9RHD0_9GAMM